MTPQVLLVDDDVVQAATRSAILTRSGLRVALAKGAEEALNLLESFDQPGALRLLVTDHLMPGMNGVELIQKVRERHPALPVLVLSGLAGAQNEYEGLEVSFQLKPFAPEALIRLAHSLVQGSNLRSA